MGIPNRSLAAQPTSFIGRENDVAAIIDALEEQHCRLLTLVGPGGAGKTRLGIEAAERFMNPKPEAGHRDLFPDGIFMASLQSVAAANNVIPAIAGAMGFEFYEAHHLQRQLISHIGDKRILLFLDNLEHLLPAGELISDLLSAAGGLKIIATSREPLNLREEWLFDVQGMPFPESKDDSVAAYDAVRLFMERARRVRRDFSLEDEQSCVVRLCQLVEGLPLAIELAAAWLRKLSCAEIVTEIARDLDILETNMAGVTERHRSMKAVFDYSWRLLSQEERDLFMMLSVFQGGFRREAAEQITGASLQTLSALVDKSLVAVLGNGRYQLHELHRQYAAQRLAAAADRESAVRDRHCIYYMAHLDRSFQDYWGYRGNETLAEIDADIDNVLAAWYWAVAQGRYRDLHKGIDGLLPYWYHRWHFGVEKAFHDALIALRSAAPGPERDRVWGFALAMQSSIDLWLGDLQLARERAEEGIAILEPLNARSELSHAFGARARAACWVRDRDPEQAEALVLEAVALFEETGQLELVGLMYTMLGFLNYDVGQIAESDRWFQKDLGLSRETGDPLARARSLGNLGRNALIHGRYPEARQFLLESLEIARLLRNKSWINESLNRLGLVAMAVGDLETAERIFQECLSAAKEWGKPFSIAYSMTNLAAVLAARKEYRLAEALYHEAAHDYQVSRTLQADTLFGLGRIAFDEGAYGQAQRHHEESLQICKAHDYLLLKARNEDALGHIAVAQSRVDAARSYLRTALEESAAIGAAPLILEILISIADLRAFEGAWGEAAELAALLLNHPASSAESRARAARLLAQTETAVPAAGVQLDRAPAGDNLGQVAAHWLAHLSGPEQAVPAATGARVVPLLDPLSARELELLRLVAEGKSNREIAGELTLAIGTVKSHLNHIFQKLDSGSRTQAIVRAKELGLL